MAAESLLRVLYRRAAIALDPTDLMALPVLIPAWRRWDAAAQEQPGGSRRLRVTIWLCVLLALAGGIAPHILWTVGIPPAEDTAAQISLGATLLAAGLGLGRIWMITRQHRWAPTLPPPGSAGQ